MLSDLILRHLLVFYMVVSNYFFADVGKAHESTTNGYLVSPGVYIGWVKLSLD